MANHPSALKRARQNEKRRLRNASTRTRIRNLMKKVRLFLENKSVNEAQAALKEAIPRIQKAASKGVIHRNTSQRYISRLSRQVAALSETSS
ncbi:MAG: 30S ribosomal protein S20 [Deltaproteobacteria bacterium]|nr:30S ribosomal protein S20 [Deltaproteobacteria bacterium]